MQPQESVAHSKIAEGTKACATAHNIAPDQVATIRSTVDKSTIQASNDVKCFAKCVTDMSGVLSGGVLDIDRLVKLSEAFGKDGVIVRANAERCKERLPSVDSCDQAWELYTCLY